MPRTLITSPVPRPPTEISDDYLVVAPHSRIAQGFSAPFRSLQSIAKDLLKKNGFGIATPIKAAETLRRAVGFVMHGSDASAVARHHREIIGAMLRSGVDTKKLGAAGLERARMAALIAERYVELLGRDRLIDPDAALITAVKSRLVRHSQVLIYGYFRARQLPARPEEIEFIDALAGEGTVFYLPCGDGPIFHSNREWRDRLTSRGWIIGDEKPTAFALSAIEKLALRFSDGGPHKPEDVDDVKAVEHPDLVHEVRVTLAAAKAAIINGLSVNEIAIVCRDMKTYSQPIISVAREYGLPVRLDCEIAIAETELGRFIALILDVVEKRSSEEIAAGAGSSRRGFAYGSTMRLMQHRLGPGLTEPQKAAAYRSIPSDYDAWRSISEEVELVYAPGGRPFADWVLWLRNLLGRWDVRAKEKLGSSAEEIEAYRRLFRSLEQVECDFGAQPIDVSHFAADIADTLANVSTPLHAARGGVLIAEPNDMAGRSFDTLFVVGMAEGSLPAISSDSNVIDFFECEQLREHGIHFQDALEVPRWEALSFYFSLLACRRRIIFSYPKFALDREQIASSYFKRLGLATLPDAEKYVSSRGEYRRAFLADPARRDGDEVFSAAMRQFDVERRRESSEPADQYDGVIGIPIDRTNWSATSLIKFGSCRFKWFASEILKLREPEEADTDLPANTRGTLLHKTLELAVGRSRNEPDLRKAVLEDLETAFAEAEKLDDSLIVISNWHLRRSEQIEKLRIAVASKEFLASGASVVEVEKKFIAEFCGLTIRGTIDRIDRLADESILAVDYKHGQTIGKVQDESGYLNIEIQLPLYYLAALPKLYPEDQHSGGQFFHIAEPKLTKARDVDLATFLERVKRALEAGDFAVAPDVKGDACEYCSYDVVCRVGPRLTRKPV